MQFTEQCQGVEAIGSCTIGIPLSDSSVASVRSMSSTRMICQGLTVARLPAAGDSFLVPVIKMP